ncbi:8359_t:CDS:1, partial [Racocetra persica]
MIRNFVLLFVFLAAFSMVNVFPYHLTKKATQFGQCPVLFNPPPYTTIISDVKLTPKTNSQLEVN